MGFRRWYERKLYESFGWLTACLMSGLAIATVLEMFGLAGPVSTTLATLALVYLMGVMGLSAWRRFCRTLTFAQRCAGQATCATCGAYGLFRVTAGFSSDGPRAPAVCRRCGTRWDIGEPTGPEAGPGGHPR